MLLTFYCQQTVRPGPARAWILVRLMLTFQCHLVFFVLLSDKTIKLWKISERDKRAEGYNLKDEDGRLREPFRLTSLRVCSAAFLVLKTFRHAFPLTLDSHLMCRRYQCSCQWISW